MLQRLLGHQRTGCSSAMIHYPVLAGLFFAVLNNYSAQYFCLPGHRLSLFLLWKKFEHLDPSDFGDLGSTLVVVMVEKKSFLKEISRNCNIPGSVLHKHLEGQMKSLPLTHCVGETWGNRRSSCFCCWRLWDRGECCFLHGLKLYIC